MIRLVLRAFAAFFLALSAQATPMMQSNSMQSVQTLFESKQYDQVISRLQGQNLESLSKQDQPQAYLLLGLSYGRNGQSDKALGVLQLAAELFPKEINILSALADLLHREELDDQAKPIYEKVISIHPNNSNAHLGLAEIEHSQGFLERSIDHYQRCLDQMPKEAPIWRAYAAVLSERLEYAKATAAVQKALSLAPSDALSLESLAVSEHRQGHFEQADDAIRKAIVVSRNKTPFRLEYALWLLEEDHLDESSRQVALVLLDSPQNPLARWIRASIALRRNNVEGAVQDLRFAASRNEQYPFISATAQAMLDQLEGKP
jgi:Tfp pilus assembly protein PilF